MLGRNRILYFADRIAISLSHYAMHAADPILKNGCGLRFHR